MKKLMENKFKKEMVTVRISKDDKMLWKTAKRAAGYVSMSEWLNKVVNKEALKAIKRKIKARK